jgi:hypothetical protein
MMRTIFAEFARFTADVVGAIDCSYRRISEKEYIHVETISVALELAYKFWLCLIQVQQRIEGCGSSSNGVVMQSHRNQTKRV